MGAGQCRSKLDQSALALFDDLDALVDGLVWDADGLESCYDSAASLLPTPPSSDGSVRDFSPMEITESLDFPSVPTVVPPNANAEEIIDVVGDDPAPSAGCSSPASPPLSNAATAKRAKPTTPAKVRQPSGDGSKPRRTPTPANPTAKNSADGIIEGQSPITALLQLSSGDIGGINLNSHDESNVSDAARDVMSLLKAYLSVDSQDTRDIPLDDASESVMTPMVHATPSTGNVLQHKDCFDAESSNTPATVDAIDAIFDETIAQLLTPPKDPPLGGSTACATASNIATPLLDDLAALGLLDPVTDDHSPEAEPASRVRGSSTAASPVDDAVRQILMAFADSCPENCANSGDGELGDLELDGLVEALECELQVEEAACTDDGRRALGGSASEVGR
ncbi:hypothetical protein HK405_006170 [Cladochytrium tenue]|nr:hypothetical protein HK405_006170 [Cladochytrium tenue]